MPAIIDYQSVLDRLQADGLVCHYPNGGAFGFPPETATQVRGWIGPPDSTIRPAIRPLVRRISEPFPANLAELACRAWQLYLPGSAWVMPGSHWSFELTHGSRAWIHKLFRQIDISPDLLATRTNAAAIEFSRAESPKFQIFIEGLLAALSGSDFSMCFPGHPTVCTIHHHKQLWWVTSEPDVLQGLDTLVPLT